MAGGKLTPRQKMINLMYLVFIAMLAMNMSKEVLSAFGLMNEKFESSNTAAVASNQQMLVQLDQKASEAKGEFAIAANAAHKVETTTKDFYDYVGKLKAQVLEGVEIDPETGKLPYEAMDKGESIDNWFVGEGNSNKGNEIIAKITKYKADMKSVLADKKYATIISELDKKFDVSDVTNKDGLKIKFLEYKFKGFPSVASLANLSTWQTDIKKAESDVYSAALGNAAVNTASMNKYQAIVVLDKNAYFQGEKVTGKVVLGRYDENTKPTSVSGASLDPASGQAKINLTAGNVGEQNIGGSFNFIEDKKTINLPFKGTYVVVPRPNSATISADKMNVVYRGVINPITVSFAGVGDNLVSASAPGMSKAAGVGKYNLSPGQGTELKINVNAKLPDGSSVSDAKVFRIKNIPGPVGTIGGEMNTSKGAKSRLLVSQVGAKLPDFDFDVKLQVVGFTLKAAGQAAVIVSGDRVNAQCTAALAKSTRGDQITIFDIKTKVIGSDIIVRTAPVIYEIL